MVSLETTIEDCLCKYVQIILRFERALIHSYNLPDNPYQCRRLFPKAGNIKEENKVFEYNYHGAGCSFECADLEVHYDYLISEPDYIVTVPWKFWRFVVTYLKCSDRSGVTIDEVAEVLEKLNDKGIVRKVYPEFLQYQVNFSWAKASASLANSS